MTIYQILDTLSCILSHSVIDSPPYNPESVCKQQLQIIKSSPMKCLIVPNNVARHTHITEPDMFFLTGNQTSSVLANAHSLLAFYHVAF